LEAVNILLVEDDDNVALTVERCLRRENYKVTLATSGMQALQIARRRIPDLILLDVTMPGMDGYAVCREIRADSTLERVPIIFLTARNRDEDRISGFQAGGDDYINKPFNLEELLLRVRAVLRRTQEQGKPERKNTNPEEEGLERFQNLPGFNQVKNCLELRGYSLDLRTYEVTLPDRKKILLTPIQFNILVHLMSHPGEIFSPLRLLDEIWDYPSDAGSPDLVRVHIKNLRSRVEKDPLNPLFIETIPGYGYTIKANPAENKT
jgi:two-component system alkaline phosphatase synthesis response regulator PhoP/two-component system response regulator RpaA